eukprot:SAG31_NODE_4287_length_3378_cov_4.554132_2_plen_239_part_00
MPQHNFAQTPTSHSLTKGLPCPSGYMGARVAAELAICGCTVRVYDKRLQQSAVAPVEAVIREADHNELLGHSAGAARQAASRVTACSSIGDVVQGCRLVCECAIEDPQVKADIFNEAAKVCPGNCVFTTSSLNIPLAEIQRLITPAWKNRLIGLRFLAPVLSMPLVEVTYEPGIEQRSECARSAVAILFLLLTSASNAAESKRYATCLHRSERQLMRVVVSQQNGKLMSERDMRRSPI